VVDGSTLPCMDSFWQWGWDRYGPRYSWVISAVSLAEFLSVYLVLSTLIVAFERSNRYIEATAITVGVVLVLVYVQNLPGLGASRRVELWAARRETNSLLALKATYTFTRKVRPRAVAVNLIFVAALFVLVAANAGATGSRLVQYALLGAGFGVSVLLIAIHSYTQAAMRPARIAIAGDTPPG
jgi:adenylate cyclase